MLDVSTSTPDLTSSSQQKLPPPAPSPILHLTTASPPPKTLLPSAHPPAHTSQKLNSSDAAPASSHRTPVRTDTPLAPAPSTPASPNPYKPRETAPPFSSPTEPRRGLARERRVKRAHRVAHSRTRPLNHPQRAAARLRLIRNQRAETVSATCRGPMHAFDHAIASQTNRAHTKQ